MTKEQAMEMLKSAPRGDTPSKVNKELTKTMVVDIVEKWVASQPDGTVLEDLFVKRVRQATQNTRHPK